MLTRLSKVFRWKNSYAICFWWTYTTRAVYSIVTASWCNWPELDRYRPKIPNLGNPSIDSMCGYLVVVQFSSFKRFNPVCRELSSRKGNFCASSLIVRFFFIKFPLNIYTIIGRLIDFVRSFLRWPRLKSGLKWLVWLSCYRWTVEVRSTLPVPVCRKKKFGKALKCKWRKHYRRPYL